MRFLTVDGSRICCIPLGVRAHWTCKLYQERSVSLFVSIDVSEIDGVVRTGRVNSIVGNTIHMRADAKGENYLDNGRNSQ